MEKPEKPQKPFIPEPCPMRWHAMKPGEGGRYCDKCEKEVMDLTGKSVAEIRTILENRGGEVCGRVESDKLRLSPEQRKRRDRRRRQVRAAAACVLAAGIIVSPGMAPATGVFYHSPLPGPNLNLHKDVIIKGKSWSGLSGIKVKVRNTDLQARTDSAGQYMIRVPAQYSGQNVTLEFRKKKYRTGQYTVTLNRDTIVVDPWLSRKRSGWAAVFPRRRTMGAIAF